MLSLITRMTQVAEQSQGHDHAADLNKDLDLEEVLHGIYKLHSGRVPGPDGLRAEFIKNAYQCIAEWGQGGEGPHPCTCASSVVSVLVLKWQLCT